MNPDPRRTAVKAAVDILLQAEASLQSARAAQYGKDTGLRLWADDIAHLETHWWHCLEKCDRAVHFGRSPGVLET